MPIYSDADYIAHKHYLATGIELLAHFESNIQLGLAIFLDHGGVEGEATDRTLECLRLPAMFVDEGWICEER
jgi:hypothetical protein